MNLRTWLKNPWHLLMAAVFVLVSSTLRAAEPPEYEGTVFSSLQAVIDDASLFFGVVVALAIVVTGFFLGRRWLRSVG